MATSYWIGDILAAAGNHLWQSTLFAAGAALSALLFRRHQARVRHAVWLAASIKFLVPFAVLAALGGQLSWRTVEVVPYQDGPSAVVSVVSEPFSQDVAVVGPQARGGRSRALADGWPLALLAVWLVGCAAVVATWLTRWFRVRALVRTARPLSTGREVEMLRRLAPRYSVAPLPMAVADAAIEPGVFGIARPVLVWPRGISERLSDEQVEAVLAHELCHARRRDNLSAVVHMAVQAAFWFHPLVWWIGARLVDERERACDEEVVGRGSHPEVYAESILQTCKFFLESPLPCVAGVTGSDLKRRVEQIMNNHAVRATSGARKAALVAAAIAAFVTPVAVGALNPPPQTRAVAAPDTLPAFDEISVRPNTTPGRGGRGGALQPGRFVAQNLTVKTMIKLAHGRQGSAPGSAINLLDQQVEGGPEWLDVDKFDVVATAPGQTPPPQMRLMIQRMLADRFKLVGHWEQREMPVYLLTKSRPDGSLGPGLTPTSDEECAAGRRDGPPPPFEPGKPQPLPPCGAIQFGPGQLVARGAPIEWLSNVLVTVPVVTGVDRPVINRTGIEGNYGFTLKFSPAQNANPDPDRPHLFTALEEQLGLKLESTRAPVDVLVIDRVEKPAAN
jgi:uncharacterized protein (TIGR03435 family)